MRCRLFFPFGYQPGRLNMEIDVASSNVVELYQALVGVITPRPIAWVSTLSPSGSVNLAPFSFFNLFGANPPVVVFSPILRRDGSPKDTLLNVARTNEFVVNVATESLAGAVNQSSKDLAFDESELEWLGLRSAPSYKIKTPRVADSPVSLECVLEQIVPIGDGPLSANLVIGRVVQIGIADELLGLDGKVDPRRLQTIGRLGGDDFCRTTDLFRMPRP